MRIILERLSDYMKEKCSSLKEVNPQWPDPSTKLDLPCCSIIQAGKTSLRNIQPVFIKNKDGFSYYATAEVEMALQLDLWASYDTQRDESLIDILDCFDSQFTETNLTQGLRLTVSDYHDSIASYEVTGYTILDAEDSSTIAERRVKIDVVCNYQRVVAREEGTMDQIKLRTDIGEKSSDTLEETII